MSQAKAKQPLLRRPFGITLLTTGVIVLLLSAVLGARLITLSGQGDFSPPLNEPVVYTVSTGSIGVIQDFFVSIRSSSDQPIILQSTTFDRGIPAHVVLLHTAILLLSDGSCCEYSFDTEWPPRIQQGNSFTLRSVQGFTLAPGASATLVYAVRVDAPGTYTLGPVTLHGMIPAFGDSWAIGLPVARTYHSYDILCFSGHADCLQAQQSI